MAIYYLNIPHTVCATPCGDRIRYSRSTRSLSIKCPLCDRIGYSELHSDNLQKCKKYIRRLLYICGLFGRAIFSNVCAGSYQNINNKYDNQKRFILPTKNKRDYTLFAYCVSRRDILHIQIVKKNSYLRLICKKKLT